MSKALFPKDYEHIKILIDKAIQRNQDYIRFQGIRLDLCIAKKMYMSYEDERKKLNDNTN